MRVLLTVRSKGNCLAIIALKPELTRTNQNIKTRHSLSIHSRTKRKSFSLQTNKYQLIITSDFVRTYIMQYYDEMRVGTDQFFSTFLGVQLDMSVFIRDTSQTGKRKIFDVNDDVPTGDNKGTFISTRGNTPYSEYNDYCCT